MSKSNNESLTSPLMVSGFKMEWETPQLRQLGKLSALVLGGGGKLSPPSNDPGEPRKPSGNP